MSFTIIIIIQTERTPTDILVLPLATRYNTREKKYSPTRRSTSRQPGKSSDYYTAATAFTRARARASHRDTATLATTRLEEEESEGEKDGRGGYAALALPAARARARISRLIPKIVRERERERGKKRDIPSRRHC